jgi:hypothetical protein
LIIDAFAAKRPLGVGREWVRLTLRRSQDGLA